MGRKKEPQAAQAARLLGQNVIRFRRRLGLSQQGAAECAGLHRTEVALVEAGRRAPRLDTIVKLGGALQVEPCALLAGMTWELEGPMEKGSKMSGLDQEDRWVEKEWTLGERFGANLVWFRRKARLTQQELADRIGMSRKVLSELERGRCLPRLDTILKLVVGLEVGSCDLVAWMWWDPASHHHYEFPPSESSGHEVLDFDLPAGFRISPVGYETRERFKDRLRQRREDPVHRAVLELLRDDAPPHPPRPRPDAAWVLRTGQALKALREERGLTQEQLAERSPTTAAFIREIEEGRISDPGLRILTEICHALDGEGSELSAQIEPVRAARKAAVQEVLDELAERDARQARE